MLPTPFLARRNRKKLPKPGDAGADVILKRMKQGPGHELYADGERPDAAAHDCCNMTVVADHAVGRYQIVQNQVGDRPVTLARGLTREAARRRACFRAGSRGSTSAAFRTSWRTRRA